MSRCRLLPFCIADGPHNMAADEALLESAGRGTASLRFYGWSLPTLSLGYFQPAQRRSEDERLAALPFVRRFSGGDALVHHHETTYALALPAGADWHQGESWPCRMHKIIAAALVELGVTARLHVPPAHAPSFTGVLCFQHTTAGDLMVGVAKIVGSAQRRQRGALVQHGGILLAASPYTPDLPGILDLTGHRLEADEVNAAIARQFAQVTACTLQPADWTAEERDRIKELAREKYGSESWNRKR